MAKIIGKKLYLLKRERPNWWKPKEYVQIIFNEENMFFVFHRTAFKEGYLKIDENFCIELDIHLPEWTVKEHSPECICLLNNVARIAYERKEKSEETLRDKDNIFSKDLRDVKNMSKADYAFSFREAVALFVDGEISTSAFRELTKALDLIIRDWDIYDIEEEEEKQVSVEDLKEALLKKAKDPNTNIIDIVRTINSISGDGEHNKQRELDDIIIDTEESNDDLDELEIEIGE